MSSAWHQLHQELRYEPVHQRIRVSRGERLVVETTDAVLVWEPRRVVPSYAVPRDDLHAELLEVDRPPDDPDAAPPVLVPGRFGPHLSDGRTVSLRVGDEVLDEAGFVLSDPDLDGRVLLDWDQFTWVEEAARMTGHAQDPFKYIKTLPSDRHVVVSLDGQVLADTRRAVLLLETSLPPRWYIPAEDVRVELLEPSSTHTICAYKGRASYWSVAGHEHGRNLAWFYPDPLHDALPVKDMVCFWVERSDLTIDGVAVPRPRSVFSENP